MLLIQRNSPQLIEKQTEDGDKYLRIFRWPCGLAVASSFLRVVVPQSPYRRNSLRANSHQPEAGRNIFTRGWLDLRRLLVTVPLQPQMKKYRCPWYMSTKNHNILYFVRIWSIRSLNTAIRLWKAPNSLVGCGLCSSNCTKTGENQTPLQASSPIPSLSPRWRPHKAQNQCSFSDFSVHMWTIGIAAVEVGRSSPQDFRGCCAATHFLTMHSRTEDSECSRQRQLAQPVSPFGACWPCWR